MGEWKPKASTKYSTLETSFALFMVCMIVIQEAVEI